MAEPINYIFLKQNIRSILGQLALFISHLNAYHITLRPH